jgi:uroporphyrinogen III methyltransferase/synthase
VRVLVTRALQDAASLTHALVELGHEPVLVPLIEVTFQIDALAALAAAVPGPDWVLVTSGVGADAIAVSCPSAWRRARWAAVGPATAHRLRERGLPVTVVPERFTAMALIAALGDLAGQVLIMPRGDLAPAEPVLQLRAAGATVHDVVCYANSEPPNTARDVLASLPVHATTLFSGSAAERLAAAVPAERRAELGRVVVVGPSTAETCARVGLHVHAVADQHTVAGVVRAIGTG